MGFVNNLFGKKEAPGESDSAAAAITRELFHKVEQALNESVKVAMRLIENRPPEVDTVVGYGAPLYEPFANLVFKVISMKHQQANSHAHLLTLANLPTLAPLDAERLGDFDQLINAARETGQELILLRQADSTPGRLLESIEAHLEFLLDPRTILILIGTDEFLVKRDFLLSTAQTLVPETELARIPGHLADLCRGMSEVEETPRFMTTFGYPLDKFSIFAD